MTQNTEDLLREAAKFVDRDQGSPGFLDRFTQVIKADPAVASRVLDQVLAARARAGAARLRLKPGDLEVMTTSSGATLVGCALAGQGAALAASVRLTDAAHRPVSGAVLRIIYGRSEGAFVTDSNGRVSIDGTGSSIVITVGAQGRLAGEPKAHALIPFPRRLHRDELTLAAADKSGTGSEAAEASPWSMEVGGVKFSGQERKGGYDLTVMAKEITESPGTPTGVHAVSFMTRDAEDNPHWWIVPLAPGPLAYAGTLYATDEDSLERDSVTVGDAMAVLVDLGEQFDEVIGRSVMHADTRSAWLAVAQRLAPGPLRDSVHAALAQRAST